MRLEIDIVFALLLLGHIIGDFYCQPEKISQGKKAKSGYERFSWLLLHGGVYAACMVLVLFTCLDYRVEIIYLWLFAGASHFAIDFLRIYLIKNRFVQERIFVTGQILHLALLGAGWYLFGGNLQPNGLADCRVAYLPGVSVILLILGALLTGLPLGRLISKNEIYDFYKTKGALLPGRERAALTDCADKMIGYLERLLVFFLLMFGQYTAAGFIVIAKAVIYLPDIYREKDGQSVTLKTEYYLIGTLLNSASVFLIMFMLGLLPK